MKTITWIQAGALALLAIAGTVATGSGDISGHRGPQAQQADL